MNVAINCVTNTHLRDSGSTIGKTLMYFGLICNSHCSITDIALLDNASRHAQIVRVICSSNKKQTIISP